MVVVGVGWLVGWLASSWFLCGTELLVVGS